MKLLRSRHPSLRSPEAESGDDVRALDLAPQLAEGALVRTHLAVEIDGLRLSRWSGAGSGWPPRWASSGRTGEWGSSLKSNISESEKTNLRQSTRFFFGVQSVSVQDLASSPGI